MLYELPSGELYDLRTIVLDLNGTLSVYGKVPDGVTEHIQTLRESGYNFLLLTGDVRGTGKTIADSLGIPYIYAGNTEEKKQIIQQHEPVHCVAIGNARIDIGMFEVAKLSIGTLQAEGIHVGILPHIDILVPSVTDALQLLIDPAVFRATMR